MYFGPEFFKIKVFKKSLYCLEKDREILYVCVSNSVVEIVHVMITILLRYFLSAKKRLLKVQSTRKTISASVKLKRLTLFFGIYCRETKSWGVMLISDLSQVNASSSRLLLMRYALLLLSPSKMNHH